MSHIVYAQETWGIRPFKDMDTPVSIVTVRVSINVRVEMFFHRLQPQAVLQELRNALPR